MGSALFDVICLLPEYGLSRAGMRLLQRHSHEIVSLLPMPVVVAELGSGSGQKTRLLLEALSKRQRVNYYPIDISGSALSRCQQEIGQMDRVSIVGFESAYLEGLQEVAARRRDGERILVLFLGSTIGNFDRPAGDQFLREVRRILSEGDASVAGDGSGEAHRAIAAGVRRSGGSDGGVQYEFAGADQSGTGRGFRPAAIRACGAL